MMNRGLDEIMEKLITRFAMDAGCAIRKFRNTIFEFRDLLDDEHSLRKYIQIKMRYACGMGILDRYNDNWRGVMTDIWISLDLNVQ